MPAATNTTHEKKPSYYKGYVPRRSTLHNLNDSDLVIVAEEPLSDPSNSISNPTNTITTTTTSSTAARRNTTGSISTNSNSNMNPNAIRSIVARPAQIEPGDAVDMDNTIHYIRGKGILASKREIAVHPDGTYIYMHSK